MLRGHSKALCAVFLCTVCKNNIRRREVVFIDKNYFLEGFKFASQRKHITGTPGNTCQQAALHHHHCDHSTRINGAGRHSHGN